MTELTAHSRTTSKMSSKMAESDATLSKAVGLVVRQLRRPSLRTRQVGMRVRADSTAHPVELDLTVIDLWNADVKSESFMCKLKIRARWVCPTEHAEEALEEGGDGLDTDWEPEWFPRISIASATETHVEHT